LCASNYSAVKLIPR